jgi:hypothetical protein
MCQATIKRLSNHFESCQMQKVASLLTEALSAQRHGVEYFKIVVTESARVSGR